MDAAVGGLGEVGEEGAAVGAGAAEGETEEQSEEQDADGVVPIEEFEAPVFAREFLGVGPGAPAEHGDDAEDDGPGIAVKNEHERSVFHTFTVNALKQKSLNDKAAHYLPWRLAHSASNSDFVGKDFWVPTRVVESAA